MLSLNKITILKKRIFILVLKIKLTIGFKNNHKYQKAFNNKKAHTQKIKLKYFYLSF